MSGVFRARQGSISHELIVAQQGEILKVGFLRKKGHLRRNWLDRWFVLTTEGLYYYKGKDEQKPLGVIPLIRGEAREDTTGRHVNVFTCVTIEGKDYSIQASTKDEMNVWVRVIGEAMKDATQRASNPEVKKVASSEPLPVRMSVSNGSKPPPKPPKAKEDEYDSYEDDDAED